MFVISNFSKTALVLSVKIPANCSFLNAVFLDTAIIIFWTHKIFKIIFTKFEDAWIDGEDDKSDGIGWVSTS